MQSVKLADENCASNLSAAEASEFFLSRARAYARMCARNLIKKEFEEFVGEFYPLKMGSAEQ